MTQISRRIQGFDETPKDKIILRDVSGKIVNGELVAFMGPSGAGKSTLLECIVGQRISGKTGVVRLLGSNIDEFKISFIPQRNQFLSQLTVWETVLFAAKLQTSTEAAAKNSNIKESIIITSKQNDHNDYCLEITNRAIKSLGLEICADNRLNCCSGGQLKRVAIAQELVGNPNMLVLDEPTSGLDSASCIQVVDVLRELTKQNITVLASIHQPSVKILNRFHKLYVISASGECIYENTPEMLTTFLKFHDLECPPLYNPADFLIEVALGEHSITGLQSLVEDHREIYERESRKQNIQNNLQSSTNRSGKSTIKLSHVLILMERYYLITFRDPISFGVRVAATILVPLLTISLFGTDVGKRGGCPPKFEADFEPSQLTGLSNEIEEEVKTAYNNCGNIFFIALFAMANALFSTVLSFPREMVALKNEKQNHWYSLKTFIIAKNLSDMPLQMFYVLLYWPFTHYMQGQIAETWRVVVICILLLLTQLIAESIAEIFGAVFMYNIPAALYLGPGVGILPCILLSGAFVKLKNMSLFYTALSYFDYMRFIIEGILVSLYGFGRCDYAKYDLKEGKQSFTIWLSAMLGVYDDENEESLLTTNASHIASTSKTSEKFVDELIDTFAGNFLSNDNKVRSLVMNTNELEDWYLFRAIIASTVYLITMRIFAYYVIKSKACSTK
ncbi:ABC transporter sub-family G-like protein 1 [Leptotrombidium deliense]|uniref:ABC transporter sub-family G-like protein 1 n=1 Tax=Leptotrombidium deliense TaxID=299467 RepID=A0A443SF68_9ACAR|nr:ABC transporter sub-family G-like protein 1 [Leptotrombidium deliense]